jgi:hypothetical protein
MSNQRIQYSVLMVPNMPSAQSYIVLMDFDKCTGLFSNPRDSIFNQIVAVHYPLQTESGAFSANGRFVYICDRLSINQYDLWSSNIRGVNLEW